LRLGPLADQDCSNQMVLRKWGVGPEGLAMRLVPALVPSVLTVLMTLPPLAVAEDGPDYFEIDEHASAGWRCHQ
jgi:hypothetical protein